MTRRSLINLLRKRRAEREARRRREAEDFTRPLIGLVVIALGIIACRLIFGGTP